MWPRTSAHHSVWGWAALYPIQESNAAESAPGCVSRTPGTASAQWAALTQAVVVTLCRQRWELLDSWLEPAGKALISTHARPGAANSFRPCSMAATVSFGATSATPRRHHHYCHRSPWDARARVAGD